MSPKPAERQYQELKTELTICQIGGLFLAICDDENIPKAVISRMQEDMPEYFHFPLQMTDEKLLFPIFFTQTFEHIGKQSDIFHVLGIEKLSEKSQKEFIQSLQYGREQFKALPYSLVFWVQPEFIKKLFHVAPDFHHWVFGTYDFTDYQDDNNSSYQEKEKVFLKNIDEYLEKLIWEYEHWQEVKDSGKDFLLEVMSRANLAEYYIQLFCRDRQGSIMLLNDVLDEFLADNTQSFMTMLGDFGTGKTSFSLDYFIVQARKYLSDRSYRIPLFISLKDYPKKLDTQLFIKNQFTEKFNLTFSLAVFQNLMLQGKFLFFVDGFDEMASIPSKKETIQNFKELNKLSFEHLQFMTLSEKTLKNKIFMTCRTHYFFTEDQEKNILKADYRVLYRNYVTKSQYQITRIYILEFNQEQIRTYISKNTKSETSTREIFNIINDTYNLKDLANRPLLLAMIVKTLPILKNKQQVNTADLYHAYTNDWLKRDDWRSQMTPLGKRQFMWELAFKMYKSEVFSLHYSQLDKPKNEFFKSEQIKNKDDAYFVYETTACSFFNRTLDGNYKFIHRSFMEYFLSEYFFDCIINKKEHPIKYCSLNNEVKRFIKMLISYNKLHLNGILDIACFILDEIDLEGINISGSNLSKSNLSKSNLSKSNFSKSNFSEANLNRVNFSEATLSGANFENAVLKNAIFKYANIRSGNFTTTILIGANFSSANLEEANLESANLEGANLEKANIKKADLELANFSNANLEEANLESANLEGANLEGANLKRANLIGANLKWANLIGANFEGANFEGVIIERTRGLTPNIINAISNHKWRNLSSDFHKESLTFMLPDLFIDTYIKPLEKKVDNIYQELKEYKDISMLAQYIREKAFQEGLQKGKSAVLCRQISNRYRIPSEKLTGYLEKLNEEQLLELGEKILVWDSFESVQEWLDQTCSIY